MIASSPHSHRPHGERILPMMVAMTTAGVIVIGLVALIQTTLATTVAVALLVVAIAGGLIWLAHVLGEDGEPRERR
jgi:threonine/homoserine/homoserine lactone efflux protein